MDRIKSSYSIDETAKILETTIWTVYSRIKDGSLKGYRVAGGRNIRIRHEELLRFLKDHDLPVPQFFENLNFKLLLVDDDMQLLDAFSDFSKTQPSYEIKTTSSGFQAGLLVNSFCPDFIVMDLMLGDVSGKEVIKSIRMFPEMKNVKVIGISGFINEQEIEELLESGFDDFLAKPFHMQELFERIEKLNSL